MSDSESKIEAVQLEANGYIFSGIAAGPADARLVLLLHGWPQFADSWTEVARELSEDGYRAVLRHGVSRLRRVGVRRRTGAP
jgi:dienelactone hydrolase